MDTQEKFNFIEVLEILNEELKRQTTKGELQYHWQGVLALKSIGKAIESTIKKLEGSYAEK